MTAFEDQLNTALDHHARWCGHDFPHESTSEQPDGIHVFFHCPACSSMALAIFPRPMRNMNRWRLIVHYGPTVADRL